LDRWLFVHVMKAAGTSFRLMLENELNRQIYPTMEELSSLRNRRYLLAPALLERISDGRIDLEERRIICGHYAANLRDHLPGTWRTVVFLREPVARTLSMITYRRRHSGFFGRNFGRTSVAHWLKKESFVRNQICNYQTKVLSIDGISSVNQYHRIDRNMLQTAKRTVDSADLIGLTEYFGESMDIFCKMSGIPLSRGIMHANKTPGRARIADDQDIEAIRRLVPYDLEIYELARERLLARIGGG
jgi:hypothetical protein